MENVILHGHVSHPDVEAYIINLEAELNDFAEQQAHEDSERESGITETLFQIKVCDPIRSKVRLAIDFIIKTLLPTSKVFDARELDSIAQQKIQRIKNETSDKRLGIASLKRRRDAIILDPLKKRYGKWLIIIAIIVGLADGSLAFTSFRHSTYPFVMAFLAALAIGSVISISHLFYAGWIKNSKSSRERSMKILIILLLAFVFFAWVGHLRAEASNNTVSITLDNENVSAVNDNHLNGWAICIISFVLFGSVLFLSLLFWKSKKERLDIQEYDKLDRDVETMVSEVKFLETEKNRIEAELNVQKSEVRHWVEYAKNSINRCKNIGNNAIARYKRVYARYHNNDIPSFFQNSHEFEYDVSLQFFTPSKTENS